MKNEYSVSLVIPAYNEEEIIIHTLKACELNLPKITDTYEIIVVDDASTDKTGELIDDYASTHPRIKCIHNIHNEGSGKSLYIGLKKARYEFIVTDFADLPFDLSELTCVLSLFDEPGVDFVVVSRKDRTANPVFRKITSWVNYWLIRTLFNVKVGDFQFVQIYKKRLIDDISVCSRGTFVPPEIIIKALKKGFKMREYSTRFYPRLAGKSKCGKISVITQTIVEMTKFWIMDHVMSTGIHR